MQDTALLRLNLQTVGGGLFALYAAAQVARATWNLFFSPLAGIPGPRFAAISDWWLEWQGLRFRRTMAIHEALQTYGPVVRIGPNKLAVSNADDIREIYRSHNFLKSSWYDFFTFGGMPNTFCTRDPVFHAKVRRWSAPAFRRDNLRVASAALQEEMQDLVERIKHDSESGSSVDVLHLFRLLSLDVLGISVFGTRFGQMKHNLSHPFTEYLDGWLIDKALGNYLPAPVYWLLRRTPLLSLHHVFAADARMFELGGQLYDSPEKIGAGTDIVTTCKAYKDPMTGDPPSRDQVVAEATTFIGAGTDSTSIALTYAAYELAREPRFSAELRRELCRLSDAERNDLELLKELPYLNAFVKEILRVHGPAPGFFERVVPSSGAQLAGRMVPSGTIVGAQAWTSHRDDTVFPDPLTVLPERWIEPSSTGWAVRDLPPEMHNAWFPFGQGVRACIGRQLAETELLLVTSTIARNFRITLHSRTTEESMRPLDIAVVGPAAMRCLLYFNSDPLN